MKRFSEIRITPIGLAFVLGALLQPVAHAADYYVARAGQPNGPLYTSWGVAASNIADAVAAAGAGDTVWVSNATYTISTPIIVGDLTLKSFNNGSTDRDGTIIDGDGVTRCLTINNAAALVEGFTITNGYIVGNGGGVYMQRGTLSDCRVAGNVTTNGNGGGIWAQYAESIITNCDVIGNQVWSTGNADGGGGIWMDDAIVVNSRIMYNRSALYASKGGAIQSNGGSILNCDIIGNTFGGYCTAGVHLQSDVTTLRNCLIAQNTGGSFAYGGGIGSAGSPDAVIENCTVVANSGGGIGGRSSRSPDYKVLNTVSYYNTSGDLYAGGAGSTLIASNCCASSTNSITSGSGNTTDTPAFKQFKNGDYRLAAWSVGVDGGLVLPWMSTASDLDGNDRISANNLPDIGAYETTAGGPATIHYVARNGQTPASPYSSGWGGAASNIQDVFEVMSDATTILVTNGLYTVTEEIPAAYYVTIRSYNNGSVDPDGTIIKGGYPGSSNRIFTVSHRDAVLEGLTISNGYALGNGGGVYMTAGTLTNCIITDNTSTNDDNYNGGGGIYANGSDCLITDCEIAGNAFNTLSAYRSGGGGVKLLDAAEVRDSRITANRCPVKGGGSGINAEGGRIINCEVIGNTDSYTTGGIFAEGGTPTLVRNCLIAKNGRGTFDYGTGIGSVAGKADIDNCTVVNNGGMGIGARSTYNSTYRVNNTISYSNGIPAQALYAGDSGTLVASNCCASSTNWITGGSGSFTNEPQLVDYATDNYRLTPTSPCVNDGIDLPWMSTALDLDGFPRKSGPVDIGCYEYRVYGTIIAIQ